MCMKGHGPNLSIKPVNRATYFFSIHTQHFIAFRSSTPPIRIKMLFNIAVTFSLLLLNSLPALITAQASTNATAQKIGWTGTLSTLDGGLSGTITVIDS